MKNTVIIVKIESRLYLIIHQKTKAKLYLERSYHFSPRTTFNLVKETLKYRGWFSIYWACNNMNRDGDEEKMGDGSY